jgi:hypothetical protein
MVELNSDVIGIRQLINCEPDHLAGGDTRTLTPAGIYGKPQVCG